MKVPGAAAALGAFTLIVLGAGTASADNCTGIKIKAIGKKESRLLSCSAKEAVKGTVGVEPDCDNKAITKFMTAYDKPGACGDPPSADCELVAEDCRDKVRMALPDGDAMTPSPCESKRLKAAGKKASRKLTCYAKAAAKDLPVDNSPGGCLDKASTKFATAFNAVSGCTGDGNDAGIEALIDDECVNQLVTVDGMGHVTGICPVVATTTTTATSTTTSTTSTSTTTSSTTTTSTSTSTTAATLACGNFLTTWGSGGAGDGRFHTPTRVATDNSGNAYVADTNNNRIQKFTNTGTFLLTFGWGVQDGMAAFETCTSSCQAGLAGSGDGQFNNPYGLGVDASGNVFVSEYYNDRVQKFTSSGMFLTKWGSNGIGDGEFNQPLGVAVDGSGNVFVADTSNGRVQEFMNTGTFLGKWVTGGPPFDIAVDSGGNVYVAESNNHRVEKYMSSGTFLTNWGSLGSGDGEFSQPSGVAVDGSGNVFVADTGNNRIQEFTNTGTFLAKWGTTGSGNGEFFAPYGVGVDTSGNIFVADTNNNRIQKFACP